jgi:Mg2+-importing ATPase
MVSMALATPLLPFLPLAAKQILLNNFLSDVPSIAISSDNVDADRVSRPQRWNIKDIQKFMIVFGLISSAFDLLTFAVLLLIFHAGEATFQTSWFMISLLTELAVVLVLRTHKPAFQSSPSQLLLWSTLAVAAATFAIPFLGALGSVFSFVPLSAIEMAAVVAVVLGYIVATEVAKIWFFRSMEAADLSKRIRARKTQAPEPGPHPASPFLSALVATAATVAGALIFTGLLILIGTIVQLGIHAVQPSIAAFWSNK